MHIGSGCRPTGHPDQTLAVRSRERFRGDSGEPWGGGLLDNEHEGQVPAGQKAGPVRHVDRCVVGPERTALRQGVQDTRLPVGPAGRAGRGRFERWDALAPHRIPYRVPGVLKREGEDASHRAAQEDLTHLLVGKHPDGFISTVPGPQGHAQSVLDVMHG
ncbi:hypothetical protein GCM10008960_35180 [Deinococcus sedimenti]|uniref:Uncharacterized protein n=1 Tax=Deinococcus sedimenti TaxID=1867090 RepID=A0ABQ2SB27_9DEIO|nr:hypothetical protein GCM10008960_35180 [Deinococcus sedimenti]